MSATIHHFPQPTLQPQIKYRCSSESDRPSVFTDVYRDDTNIVIWKRRLSNEVQNSVGALIKSNNNFRLVQSVSPESVTETLNRSLGHNQYYKSLIENIVELVEMFCDLFELPEAGLRLATLDRAMCPKFHFDRVPCRLITTYHGAATEWLPHSAVDRSKLTANIKKLITEEHAVYYDKKDIRQLDQGDVALLKGELWHDNEDAGLVHRSPDVPTGENRLLLTLDFIN